MSPEQEFYRRQNLAILAAEARQTQMLFIAGTGLAAVAALWFIFRK